MHINCPHCQNPIEVVASAEVRDVRCPLCGSVVSLAEMPGATAAYESLTAPAESVGSVIAGKYKLLQEIGEGGMGSVFMADQTHPVKRRVAVKVIKAGMDSARVLARFEAERQALALMDHPNIAKVLDAGTTDTGRPFFVMELVKGIPLTQFCDEHKLPVLDRLNLFMQVCSAVQHAHQKGIIHRDLKPTNILVESHDGKPVPKAIDFGLAKATSGMQLTEHTLFTALGQVAGTPLYMAPEQAAFNAIDVDTRADVYALGVILYELLTGTTPIERETFKKAAFDEMLRVIREQEPPTPSSRLSSSESKASVAALRQMEPVKLGRFVRGELDWIVMKSLSKERDRRYESATAFAKDVERFLNHEPVQAGPPSAAYKLRKFVRRNRPQVVAVAVVLLALVAGMAGTTFGLIRAERARVAEAKQRQRAETNEQHAIAAAAAEKEAKEHAEASEAETQAVLEFVENKVFAAARPEGQDGGLGHEVSLRRAIEAALPFVENSFTKQPLIEARLRLTLGTSFRYLGEAGHAAEQQEAARALFARHLGPEHLDTLRSMHNLALSYADLGRHADALKLHEETLTHNKAKFGTDHPKTLNSMTGLAISYARLGRHTDALKLREETLAIQRAKLGPDHPNTLTSMHNLANSYGAVGREADALKLREETLATRKTILGIDHPDTLRHMFNLAASYAIFGRHAEALRLREETLALRKAKLGPSHPDTLSSMHNLAENYAALGRHADALNLREETLALRKAKFGPDHLDTLNSMWSVAASLVKLDRAAEAVPVIDECVQRAAGKVVDPSMIPSVMELRLRYFDKTKDAAGCRATAEMWETLNRRDADSLYSAACCRAVTATVLRVTDQSEAAVKDAAAEADRAMAWLQQAIAAGYINAAHMAKDTDLDALRDREDFKKMLAEMEASKENK